MEKFENALQSAFEPVKPYLPAIARFLLVVTYFEDSIRILSQWNEQINFLSIHRGFPIFLAGMYLLTNVIVMMAASSLAVLKRFTDYASIALGLVVVGQSIAYGIFFDISFLFRTMSIIGGLILLVADYYQSTKKKDLFAGLPSLNERDKATYLQLAGRILLVFLFLSFVIQGELTGLRIIVSIIAFIGCIMVVVGFKAQYSAIFLVAFLSISNVLLNNWWALHHLHPRRDFLKYDFFQTLSIIGGFLLLVNLGPGGISIDKKKSF